MFTVKKSLVDQIPNFELMVLAFSADMKAWAEHMRQVEEDAKNDAVPHIQKHAAYPAPKAHPLVASAINENFDPDYTIENDDPSEEEKLRFKKNALLSDLQMRENEAFAAVDVPAKRRLIALKEAEILAGDAARQQKFYQDEVIRTNATTPQELIKISADAQATGVAGRSDTEIKFMAENDARKEAIAKVDRFAAEVASDIEDLTLDTIDGWSIPEFPKV